MKKNQSNEIPKKKNWSKSDFSKYFKESRELSDYSCAKSGIDFLGYIVRPHRLLIRKRTVSMFKDKLAFFNHILSPEKNSLSVKTDYEIIKYV